MFLSIARDQLYARDYNQFNNQFPARGGIST